ncbi:hypothetical protein CHS0354_016020 [Potamilus streckersoni]|uniref:LTD domain-containing protein n=1 Tax=Potamilus streckersoni TaxID=2493646 RepID=A0AAE0VGN3_9BIVA|nr:hypothetical protein CHS0354_016020 [Potamilus streckersoni]
MLEREKSAELKAKKTVRFSEDLNQQDTLELSSLRSPSRLGYVDSPLVSDRSFNSDVSEANDFKLIDLEKGEEVIANPDHSTAREEFHEDNNKGTNRNTEETDQKCDLIPGAEPDSKRKRTGSSFIQTRKFLPEAGQSAKHPFEKTVYVVKSVPCDTSRSRHSTQFDIHSIQKSAETQTSTQLRKIQSDSGYSSFRHQYQTVPAQPSEDKSPKSDKMSYYNSGEVLSPVAMTRLQEKEELQRLNDRFTSYIHKVRQTSEKGKQIDASVFIKSTKILEDEVRNIKHLYEKELDDIRLQLETAYREKNNLQLQVQKNQQASIDLESRLSVENDRNRRLTDEINTLQRKLTHMEAELLEVRSVTGQPKGDVESLRHEIDKLVRENQELKRRYEKETLMLKDSEDRLQQIKKKMEFDEQVHSQQILELQDRLENSSATVISLESRLRDLSRTDDAIPEILKQVREASDLELKRFRIESEEQYNRNISALKAQMDNDAATIERLTMDKSQLQGGVGELHAKIRSLEGQLRTLEHQKSSLEELVKQEREHSADQIKAMEKKLRDMQELVFAKVREASSVRESYVPLKTEIEALKIMLEEEERRLQVPVQVSQQQKTSYRITSPLLPPPSTLSQPTYPSPVFPVTSGQAVYPPQQTQTAMPPQTVSQTYHTTGYSDVPYTSIAEPVYPPAPLTEELPPIDVGTTTKYTYETTPSVNHLHIESSPPATPRAIGPISRAKSAPAGSPRNVHLIPSSLGQGKDYFDEMFKDLTRETLQSPARAKSAGSYSPADRPPSESPRQNDRMSPDRLTSSVHHDYTTSTSSAIGDTKILEVNQEGKYIRLVNEGKQDVEFGGYMIQQNVGGHPVAIYRFPPRTKFAKNTTITVWSGNNDHLLHDPPGDFVWKEQQKWGTGPECTTILCKPNGQAIAWTTAAHRFTKNAYEDTSMQVSSGADFEIREENTGALREEEVLTEVNVNINEPKPEQVYLRREKQQPPSLSSQKHPHGSHPLTETHPHTGQPRPFTYGNDNSSVNRQSRVQTTRPDPIYGQPYAGASANRLGSAPLRQMHSYNASGVIRGNGTLANKSAGTIRYGPPSPFLSPLQQEYSQALLNNKATSLVCFSS